MHPFLINSRTSASPSLRFGALGSCFATVCLAFYGVVRMSGYHLDEGSIEWPLGDLVIPIHSIQKYHLDEGE